MPDEDPVAALRSALAISVRPWLVRSVITVAAAQGLDSVAARTAAEAMADEVAAAALVELDEVLLADVDSQRDNPLAVLRRHIAGPTAVLDAIGASPVRRDEQERAIHPDDRYGLSPATWADVDEVLREPGLVWGAWKAATILSRRRSEGLR